MLKKKIKDLTERELNDICNKNCKNCRECPLVISQSDYHIDCMLTPELVRTQEKEIEILDETSDEPEKLKMTSKEAILELLGFIAFQVPIEKQEEWKEMLNTIQKDLEKSDKIEEQLGCPLKVREKAFDKGFYDESGNHYTCEHYVPYLKAMHTRGIISNTEKCFKLKDYKKTWWLKADMSE